VSCDSMLDRERGRSCFCSNSAGTGEYVVYTTFGIDGSFSQQSCFFSVTSNTKQTRAS
jgi:hypothetical protein